jgi:asparagine synthase (glutamine-hydrolysing)
MCGIVGAYNVADIADRFPAMLGAIEHRGPDAAGLSRWAADNWEAWLGHRRLSIIDLSAAANQPMVKDGLVLIFNGEIYNYRSLRRELTTAGGAFRTGSDSEVLLEAWRHWGADCLGHLRDMFAFALRHQASGRAEAVPDGPTQASAVLAQSDGGQG